MLTPRLDILPLPQRRLWDELSTLPSEFVLSGKEWFQPQLSNPRPRGVDPHNLAFRRA
jgi:hypothetical protein